MIAARHTSTLPRAGSSNPRPTSALTRLLPSDWRTLPLLASALLTFPSTSSAQEAEGDTVPNQAAAEINADTTDWIAWHQPWNASVVDLAHLFEAPAGRHGFIQVHGDRLVFADDTEVRFWGTNLVNAAGVPPKELAPALADRLAALGFNLVRFHHMDSRWGECWIDYSREDTREMDPERFDRWHYLVAELQKRGIAIMADLLVGRHFKAGDGVPHADAMGAGAKPYSIFDRRLIDLQKEFARKLLTTINPYTGLSPVEDPAFVLGNIVNENDLFGPSRVTLEPYRSNLEDRYRAWAAVRAATLPPGPVDFTQNNADPLLRRFLIDVQREFYDEMLAFLTEELRVRIPFSGSNWSQGGLANLVSLEALPLADGHAYLNHPRWWGVDKTIYFSKAVHREPHLEPVLQLALNRRIDRPYLVTEWKEPWPARTRAAYAPWFAAWARFQDWNAPMLYCYSQTYRFAAHLNHSFSSYNDPAIVGLLPHAALLFLRDASPARRRVTVEFDPTDDAQLLAFRNRFLALYELPEIHRVDIALPGDTITGEVNRRPFAPVLPSPSTRRVSDTGEIVRDPAAGLITIETRGTLVIAGDLGAHGPVTLGPLTAAIDNPFAVIALSSLDGRPIAESADLLLTTMARVENTGARFSGAPGEGHMLEPGTAPILLEPVVGSLTLQCSRDLSATAVDAAGKPTRHLTTTRGGSLALRLDRTSANPYFRLQAP